MKPSSANFDDVENENFNANDIKQVIEIEENSDNGFLSLGMVKGNGEREVFVIIEVLVCDVSVNLY